MGGTPRSVRGRFEKAKAGQMRAEGELRGVKRQCVELDEQARGGALCRERESQTQLENTSSGV